MSVRMVSGDGQTGETEKPLSAPLVVRIEDVGSNAVPGTEMTWHITAAALRLPSRPGEALSFSPILSRSLSILGFSAFAPL